MKALLVILGLAALTLWAYNIGTVNAMIMDVNATTYEDEVIRPTTAAEAAGATISVEVKPALEVTTKPTGERFDDVQPQGKSVQ